VLDCGDLFGKQGTFFNYRHFAVALADARGSGASAGHRVIDFSTDEVTDFGETAGRAAEPPWSNGRVGSVGISYEEKKAPGTMLQIDPNFSISRPCFVL
jgi:uncharacterized protein